MEATLIILEQNNVFIEVDPEDLYEEHVERPYVNMEAQFLDSPLSHQFNNKTCCLNRVRFLSDLLMSK
jgi:hypothetical protein